MTAQDDSIAEARARLLAERAEVSREVESLRARLETKGDYEPGRGRSHDLPVGVEPGPA